MKHCQVGIFKLPGIAFDKEELEDQVIDEMEQWSKDNHCGMKMTNTLWSFKNAKHRDWFILKWCEQMEFK